MTETVTPYHGSKAGPSGAIAPLSCRCQETRESADAIYAPADATRFLGWFAALGVGLVALFASVAGAGDVPAEYAKQWNASVNRGIDERIEKYRKADAVVGGLPAGAVVRIEQQTHAFQFGSHIFNFDQLGRDDWNAQYRATFTNLWNAATVSFYWDRMEVREGEIRYKAGPRDTAEFWKSVKDESAKDKWEKYAEYRRPAPDMVLDFLDAHGISAHGHLMVYPVFIAPWVTNGVDKAGLAKRYERRIRQLGEHYGARLDQWDVVNETVDRSCSMAGPYHDKVVWGRPNHLVPDDYTFRCHRWAAEAFPESVRFEINDSWRPIYVPFIRSQIDRGSKIDVVGLQMHIFKAEQALAISRGERCVANGTLWDPESQFQMLWALDTLKRPIHISEITIPAPDDTPAGEDIQARMVRDNYRLWFSWPTVYRITYWNLVDHTYHNENLASGLYAADMRKKKAYHALDRLINHEWKTKTEQVADQSGVVRFRGFKGRYRLTWTDAEGRPASRLVEVGGLASGAKPAIAIDSAYPGGNVKVLSVDDAAGVVRVAPDLRDTEGHWFHFDFTVRGAAGRTLKFRFPQDKKPYLSSLGPAICKDGVHWTWLNADGRRHEPDNAFDYTFGPTDKAVRFAVSIPYGQKDWEDFTAKWRTCPDVRFDVLCKSQSGRRDVELLRVPARGESQWLFVFTARHHACETTGDPPMEGVLGELMSGSPESLWARDHADFLFVPFMDKDGVEDGDQGKNRRPWDYNRDYTRGRYSAVRAVKDLIIRESAGKKIVFFDLHSPYVRSFKSCPEQDQVFTIGTERPHLIPAWNRFREEWTKTQRGGMLKYDGAYDLKPGHSYWAQMKKTWDSGILSSDEWVRTLPNTALATCCEFGYSLCGGVNSREAMRELGANLLKAAVRTIRPDSSK